MALTRLNKFLSESGICSRRKADEHILAGKVSVNKKTVTELGVKVDPEKDEVMFLDQKVSRPTVFVYYAINKPRGVISTASDEKGRETVLELVPKEIRVYPVGRLDKESEGLLLLTNDGELANTLTHPKFEHEKEYIIRVRSQRTKNLSKDEIVYIQKRLVGGISIDGKMMKMHSAEIEQLTPNNCQINATLRTGFYRQIRRMCDKMGFEVVKLVRIRIGKLKLADLGLDSGEYKEIQKGDIL